ncbi:AAA family ATPase [Lachnoclostridium sp. An131]
MPERNVGKVRAKMPVGIENFKEFSTKDFYYVNKTMFIKELLQN